MKLRAWTWNSIVCSMIGVCAVLAGCGPANGPRTAAIPTAEPGSRITETSPGEPVDGDWLMNRFIVEMPHLNPNLGTGDAYTQRIANLIYDSLLERDNTTLEYGPRLAESYEISPDHLTYTFHLRRDARFSDGEPLTAHDVKFTFERIMDPAVDAADLRNYFLNIDRCEVPDDYTVVFICKEPYFKTLSSVADMLVMPRHIFGTGDFNTHPNNRHPIGTGRFTLEKWETNQQVVLARNPNYWGKKPHLEKLVYKIITDDNAALQVLEQGGLDVMGFSADQWVMRTRHPSFDDKFDRYEYYGPFHSYIGWNTRKPQFSDKRVRQALTMLLDRDLILKTIYHGYGQVVTNSFYINTIEYNRELEPFPFDPEAAKKLLDEAGWVDTNQNGIRDKDGVEFRFEFLIASAGDEDEQLATVYKEELRKAGIDMTIRPLEWATMIQAIHERKFEACRMGWSLDVEQDPYQLWHSSQAEKGSNYVAFISEEADRLMEEARLEFDHEKRAALYHRLSAIIHEEQPYTYLYCTKALVAVDKRFRNVKVYPRGLDSTEWWVPAELQRYK